MRRFYTSHSMAFKSSFLSAAVLLPTSPMFETGPDHLSAFNNSATVRTVLMIEPKAPRPRIQLQPVRSRDFIPLPAT